MLTIKNLKVINYLLSVWNIEDIANEIQIDFLEKDIRLYNSDNKFVSSYNLLPERRIKLQDYINNL